MLIPLKQSEFERYIDFAYDLALDLTRSSYPTYCDGIKTKADFIARAKTSIERPDEDILLFADDGVVEGWISFWCQQTEHFLSVNGFYTRQNTGKALEEFVEYCRARWPGFELDLGFPAENAAAVSWLEGKDIPRMDYSWNYQLNLEEYRLSPDVPGIRRVMADSFEDFAAIHRQIEGDMYWNCQRVWETLANWDIFVTETGDSAGELLMTGFNGSSHYEIFALAFADGQYRAEPFQALLTQALNTLKKRGAKWLTFFVDVGQPEGKALASLGFRLVGTYTAYRIRL